MDSQVKIALIMDDGSTAIMSFATQSRSPTLPFGAAWLNDGSGRWARPPTDANIEHELQKAFPGVNRIGKIKAKPISFHLVDQKDIPTDRTYRDALRYDGRKFYHDMPKAREIHMRRIRNARTEKLGELDREWMRAAGQKKAAEEKRIEAERQALRDLPLALDLEAARTPEELREMWPADLPGKR